jgi:cyclophilin family peptidyl-prolyl cis-trans isomerase
VNVQYTNTTNPQLDFSGPLVFQLFNSAGSTTLAPNTVSMIQQFTNDGYYTNTGKYITRIAPNFPGATDYVVQGGAATTNGTGSSGQPNTPFANENVQQLAFTGSDQLAMANSGGTNSNDTQFFITTGQPNSELGYNYTIFGQMVPNPTSSTVPSDSTTLGKLTQIPVMENTSFNPPENSQPTFNPIFTSVSLSNTNPSGTLLLDTTQATAGQTATITVTATDSVTGQTTSQSFTVTVGAYTGPTTSNLIQTVNFKPLANATPATTSTGSPVSITLNGQGTFPVSGAQQNLSYALVTQPSHGTVTNFNPNTGTLTYTPAAGFSGSDTFQYSVTSSGPNPVAAAVSNPGTVTVSVSPSPPVNTGAVRTVDTVLLVTPLPRYGHVKNTIDVIQTTPAGSTSPVIQVFVNGRLDADEPSVSSIDSIIVFGSKANDRITIDPSVQVPTLIDGGRGGRNRLKAGGVETVEHGWYGFNTMIGGNGPNQLIGLAGRVKFKPSTATDLIFAGTTGSPKKLGLGKTPPGGTFYVYKKGHLIPVPLSSVYPHRTSTGTSSGGKSGHHRKTK